MWQHRSKPAIDDAPGGGDAPADEQDFPLIIANLPATGQQKALATGVAVFLIVAALLIAPFASVQLGRIDAFIPVVQTSLSLADFITAMLLFAQYSIQPQRGLLALASGYIFSGSFAFLQTLAFPGGYAPAGVLDGAPNSAAWLYVLWHTTFPAAILFYALTKDVRSSPRQANAASTTVAITIVCVLAAIAALTWIATTKAQYLPKFYTDDRFQTSLGNMANVLLLLWGASVLAVLLFRRRTMLDLWLMVTLLAYSPNFMVAIFGSSVRFTVGWYAARCFVVVGSMTLLAVLLYETMHLYARLASAIALQRREGANRFLSVEAVTGAIAHELRSPLGAIALNASTALGKLRTNPQQLEDLDDILADIDADSHRAAAIITSIRSMTTKSVHRSALTNAEDVARLALKLLQHDLQTSEVSVVTDFHGDLPEVRLDALELQQVLLNLIRNAIDAMSLLPPEARRLRLKTSMDAQSTVLMSVEDSGPGIIAGDQERIFEPFFTTKPDGMGLGLAISARLVANYGGRLKLLRSGIGGSTFELTIPAGVI